MIAAVHGQAALIGWVCFAVGLLLILIGTSIGVQIVGGPVAKSIGRIVADAEKRVSDALQDAQAAIESLAQQAREHIGAEAKSGADAAAANESVAAKAEGATAATKSAGEEIGTIIAALPEKLRFPGLLILVGTVLCSVATTQFGGVSLF